MVPMTRHTDCPECNRLWSVYADAIMKAIGLRGKLSIAELAHDSATAVRLQTSVENAIGLRAGVRAAIESHGAQIHRDGPRDRSTTLVPKGL
jgi:hypothetical protein